MVCIQREPTNTSVIYSKHGHVWKIADFGLSAGDTSYREQSNKCSLGTSSYRPPELIQEKSVCNYKYDIWAIGCILYESVFQRRAFDGDWAVLNYSISKEPLEIPNEVKSRSGGTGDDLLHHVAIPSVTVLRTIIHSTLDRTSLRRPSANNLCSTFCQAYNWELLNVVPEPKQIVELLSGSGLMASFYNLMSYRFQHYST